MIALICFEHLNLDSDYGPTAAIRSKIITNTITLIFYHSTSVQIIIILVIQNDASVDFASSVRIDLLGAEHTNEEASGEDRTLPRADDGIAILRQRVMRVVDDENCNGDEEKRRCLASHDLYGELLVRCVSHVSRGSD